MRPYACPGNKDGQMTKRRAYIPPFFQPNSLALCLLVVVLVACSSEQTPTTESDLAVTAPIPQAATATQSLATLTSTPKTTPESARVAETTTPQAATAAGSSATIALMRKPTPASAVTSTPMPTQELASDTTTPSPCPTDIGVTQLDGECTWDKPGNLVRPSG